MVLKNKLNHNSNKQTCAISNTINLKGRGSDTAIIMLRLIGIPRVRGGEMGGGGVLSRNTKYLMEKIAYRNGLWKNPVTGAQPA